MKTFGRRVMRCFFQGLLALLPLLVTIWFVTLLFNIAERMLDDLLVFVPKEYRGITWLVAAVETAAAASVFFAMAVFGFLMRTIFGKATVRFIDSFLEGIPGIGSVYKTTRQVIGLFNKPGENSLGKPVFVEYPSAGIWSLGFDTGKISARMLPDGAVEHHTVFIPTTPNPTTGFFAVVSTAKIRQAPLTTEEAFKLIFTGGMVKTQ